MTDNELIEAAKKAAENSYSPYSGYTVGAALLSKDGKVFTGCNIENAAYSPTNCAERTAIFKAVSEGVRDFEKIAVVGGYKLDFMDYFAPCGVCRQVMREFCDEDFVILLGKNGSEFRRMTLGELLPCSFSNESMK
ncbi:MAG: cytidine deaminase [Oscillospiraceae bacterium]|nr:cytidine deaminase [Oscillospiraceae bacterium]